MKSQIHQLKDIFCKYKDSIYLIAADGTLNLSYSETQSRSLKLARTLKTNKLNSGDNVVVIANNSIDLAVLIYSIWSCGAVIVPINPLLTSQHKLEIIDETAPSMIITDYECASDMSDIFSEDMEKKLFVYNRYENKSFNLKPQKHNLGTYLDLNSIYHSNIEIDDTLSFGVDRNDHDVMMCIHTSGSTKKPKGIQITFGGILRNEEVFCQALDITNSNRFYNILPMSYLGGIHNLLLLPARVGASVVIDDPLGATNIFGFWENVRELKVNTLWFTSAMLAMLMSLRNESEKEWLSTQIKISLVGMAPLSIQLKKEFETRYGITLYENYAMSETAFLCTNKPSLEYKKYSSGKPLPNVKIEILNSKSGELIESDSVEGEIIATTSYLMKGYLNASKDDLENIYPCGTKIKTGDLGYILNDELFVTGRKKDLIIRGGLNISPAQIEEALLNIDGVSEASVVGIPHAIYGEEVAAAVVIYPSNYLSENDILLELDDNIEHFQKPKLIKILTEMPKNMAMKIDKKTLRQMFQEESLNTTVG
jgi:long-chain acyl-CoA synthetase